MNYQDVKTFLEAGFTADEIRAMNNPQNPQGSPQIEFTNNNPDTPEKGSEKIENSATDQPDPVASTDLNKVENTNDLETRFTQLNTTMQKLIKTIQVSNLHNNSMDAPINPTDINKQVDDIMAGLIRPEHKKGD